MPVSQGWPDGCSTSQFQTLSWLKVDEVFDVVLSCHVERTWVKSLLSKDSLFVRAFSFHLRSTSEDFVLCKKSFT